MNHKPRGCETVSSRLLHLSRANTPRPKRRRFALSSDAGAVTAEYAIATMAAVAFAGLLVLIMRSDEVRTLLFNLVSTALSVEL
jgi:hypothetical protein